MLIGSMLQVVCRLWLLVYLSAFVTNRRALFWTICNLFLAGKFRELRGTVGYVWARRMVVSYDMRFCVGVDLRISSFSRNSAQPMLCFWWLDRAP